MSDSSLNAEIDADNTSKSIDTNNNTILIEGWLKRRTTYLKSKNVWNDRYFILQNDKTLSYYLHRGDIKPKGIYQLNRSCIIGDIEVWNKNKSKSNANNSEEKDIFSVSQSTTTAGGSSSYRSRMSRKMSKDGGSNVTRYCVKVTWLEDVMSAVDSNDNEGHIITTTNSLDDTPPNSPIIKKRENALNPLSPQLSYRSLPPIDEVTKISSTGTGTRYKLRKSGVDDGGGGTVTFQENEDNTEKEGLLDDEQKEENGVIRHYEHQMNQQALESQYQEKMMKAMEKAAKKADKRKTYKMIMQGTGVATAAGVCLTATVLSFGVGLVPTLMFGGMSAVAGGSGAMAGRKYVKNTPKNTILVLSCFSLEEARRWKLMLEECCNTTGSRIPITTTLINVQEKLSHSNIIPSLAIPPIEGTILPEGRRPDSPSTVLRQTYSRHLATKWKPLEVGYPILLALGGTHGLRIFQEEKEETTQLLSFQRYRQLSIVGVGLCPVVKAHLVLNATSLNTFMCLMTHARSNNTASSSSSISLMTPNSEQRTSFRVIETMNDHMDVIHLIFRPLYLFPSWTAPRDFVLFRYWRFDDDGSYIICYDSVQHRECPPQDGFVRGEMHGVISIAPNRYDKHDNTTANTASTTTSSSNECLLNYIVQVDPKGWIPTFFSYQGYVETFAVNVLLQLLDVRDALDLDRFLTVSLDDIHPKVQEAVRSFPLTDNRCNNSIDDHQSLSSAHHNRHSSNDSTSTMDQHNDNHLLNYDFSYSDLEKSPMKGGIRNSIKTKSKYTAQTLSSILEPLHLYMWGEPDANSFMVRSKNYKNDNIKINAGESAFRLITVDMVQVNTPIMTGMASHPKERVQQSLNADDTPPFIFIINIVLPGPPNYHFVMYYAVDDINTINGNDGTPFSKLANKFIFGDSDEFRDKTFKLIPCIVEGNFLVRKACGTTPAIMGTKLKQHYFRTDKYCELLLDVGSSAVAAGVVRLSVGYARTLIVDIGFLLEGDDESTLPEKIMSTSRLSYVDFTKGVRFCEEPSFEENEF